MQQEDKKFLDRLFGKNEQSGFFDLPLQETCNHPEHEFPKFLYIPFGKGYIHICPGCGNKIVVKNLISN